ncbi:hypothetical protein AX279_12750 [Pseudomonas sp. J237]|nr:MULTISPECIES: hypothetical protein [Pseudomonas]OEO25363.1 hypothetical protein AX279_12750 [Pseudomonas sp. J237]
MKRTTLAVLFAIAATVLVAGCSGPKHKGGGRPDPATMIERMDANGDGKLSQSEVKGPLAEHFNDVDSNKDGVLSLDELQNMPKPQGRP